MTNNTNKILVVGQTPPPYHGQALMIGTMIEGPFKTIAFFHVRMAFSKEMNEIGKLNFYKIFHLFEIIFKIIQLKYSKSIDTLYFPPTGPNFIPFIRDVTILLVVRPFFKKIIFHFHAAGISELYPKLNPFLKWIFKKAYYNADVGIRLSTSSTNDCLALKVKKEFIVPYGISDSTAQFPARKTNNTICTILFVGFLSESKGLGILIEALSYLKNRNIPFHLNVMGKFGSTIFENKIKELIELHSLENKITFLGVLTGENKHNAFINSDIFCFPSFYEAESFPVVLLEANCYSLPIISTFWRGIPSIVEEGKNGFLVPIKDPEAISLKLEQLLSDSELRAKMGTEGRKRYINEFTIDRFYRNIEHAITSLNN